MTSEPVDDEVQGGIDAAYRAKSGGRPSVSPMSGARAATVRVRPREAQS